MASPLPRLPRLPLPRRPSPRYFLLPSLSSLRCFLPRFCPPFPTARWQQVQKPLGNTTNILHSVSNANAHLLFVLI